MEQELVFRCYSSPSLGPTHPSHRNLTHNLWSDTSPGTGTGAASVSKGELFHYNDLVWHTTHWHAPIDVN